MCFSFIAYLCYINYDIKVFQTFVIFEFILLLMWSNINGNLEKEEKKEEITKKTDKIYTNFVKDSNGEEINNYIRTTFITDKSQEDVKKLLTDFLSYNKWFDNLNKVEIVNNEVNLTFKNGN